MAAQQLKDLIVDLRQRIEEDHYSIERDEFLGVGMKYTFKYLDEFIDNPDWSDLEKAFFLILHQFPGDHKNYIVKPHEIVLTPDIYDMSCPGIEYEIDFALYGGSIFDPVKVAIDCDGLRSHGLKHNHKDRRKDVNLQAAGWITMRFGSKEIHEELDKFIKDELHVSDFLYSIENTIAQKLQLIDTYTYQKDPVRSKLTGFSWGEVTCPDCGHRQSHRLNHKNVKCNNCKTKFKREIGPEEKIEYDMNGLLFFKKE